MVKVRYEITNLGPAAIDFIWGTHPALAPAPHTVLKIPGRMGIVGLSSVPSLGTPGQRYSWPMIDTPAGKTDMSRTRGMDANVFCGHYVTDPGHSRQLFLCRCIDVDPAEWRLFFRMRLT